MESSQSSPKEDLAAVSKILHQTRSRLYGLGAFVFAALSKDDAADAWHDRDQVLEGLQDFFDALDDWMPRPPLFSEPPDLPGDEIESPPGDTLPPAVRACVNQFTFDRAACDKQSDPEACRQAALARYQQCMEAVVSTEPI